MKPGQAFLLGCMGGLFAALAIIAYGFWAGFVFGIVAVATAEIIDAYKEQDE